MVVDDEPFLSVVGARLVWADDPEYLAFSEEHATRTRTRFTRAAPDPQQIVSNAAERAVRTVTGRLGGGSHPRILRADVIYRGRRAPEPFYLELDAVTQSPTGLSVLEVKMGRPKLRAAARKQLERFAKIAGVDLWEALMKRAGKERIPVFLVGGKPDILQRTAVALHAQWNINIVGSQHGYFSAAEKNNLFERIRVSGATIVTVAMGSPGQEILMRECHRYYPQALYMGVGGGYDVFAGNVKRAPKIWQNSGLEWLYRLLSQPGRIGRQMKLFKFLIYYFSGRL